MSESCKYIGYKGQKHLLHLSEFSCNERPQIFKNPNVVI